MRFLLNFSIFTSLTLAGLSFFPAIAVAQCAPDEQDPVIIIDDGDGDTGIASAALARPAASSVCLQSGRAAAILGDQPDLLTRRDMRNVGDLATQGGTDDGGFGGPIWANISGRRAELNDNTLDTATVSIGGDVWSNDSTIIGIMLQGDTAEQDGVTTNSFEATGYMAGIYGIYQVTDFTFDGRIMAGQSENDVIDGGDRTDGVESTRWLATLQISSQRELAGGTWFLPRVSLGWLEDTMDAYTIGTDDIEEQIVSYGQADIGANVLVPVNFGGTDGNVILGASGIFAFGEDADSQVPPDLRGRVDLGLELFGSETWSVSGKVFADGFGDEDYVSAGADLGVMIWF
ncbi:autotransporter outer membrane beta-barrel domain-containing protein [Yoonia sp. 2307UL14-13]|uniref:autotransporter outer membrane beta-barrel domain-containing protein n=1 Tax=Yoonia sp. 2307UL14-13 TaxID=3126506 RepID=UPI00309DE1AF